MNTENSYDIIVTGGGLAGLSFAILAAGAGYKVALFEKEQYPFHKVCGEYISFESRDFLQRLGVPLDALHLPAIHQLNISDMQGRLYGFDLPLGGFGISRYLLDDLLYKIAREKGVQVFTGTKVHNISFRDNGFTVQHSAGIAYAGLVAGAYGKRANLDIKLQRSFTYNKAVADNNYIGIKYHVQYAHPANTIALHNFSNGYCGISAIENNQCCLCYLTTAENLRRSGNSIAVMEENILHRNPQLKSIFIGATFLYQQPLVISQVSFAKKEQVKQHILMLGDAAGLITPLCGNGMSMAMHGAATAFEYADKFLKGTITRAQMESDYTTQWKTLFARRLWMGRKVQNLFGGTGTTLFLKAMHAMPFIAKQVIKQTHGKPF